MYFPSQKLRIAIYRKAGVKFGIPLVFGSNVFIDVTYIHNPKYGVTIGDDVVISGYDRILTHSSILYGIREEGGPVFIKSGARIGINVTILPGVTIGENAVIGACSLVTHDIPDNCIAVGVPAKPIKLHHFRNHKLRRTRQATPEDIVHKVEIIK
jgi:acetyltransferase-like isoleucine patch superfamily enzyme